MQEYQFLLTGGFISTIEDNYQHRLRINAAISKGIRLANKRREEVISNAQKISREETEESESISADCRIPSD